MYAESNSAPLYQFQISASECSTFVSPGPMSRLGVMSRIRAEGSDGGRKHSSGDSSSVPVNGPVRDHHHRGPMGHASAPHNALLAAGVQIGHRDDSSGIETLF